MDVTGQWDGETVTIFRERWKLDGKFRKPSKYNCSITEVSI